MPNVGDGVDPDSDSGGDVTEDEGNEVEEEEEVTEVEEGDEEAEEEYEEDGGDEENELVGEAEEAAAALVSEEGCERSEQDVRGESGNELSEKQMCTGSIFDVKKKHDTLGERPPPTAKDSLDTVNKSVISKEEVFVESLRKRCSNGDLNGILHLKKNDSNVDRNKMDDFHENCNKRPAMACTFFARGWCVKGSSCRFLHQKDSDIGGQPIEENLAGTSSQMGSKEDIGQHGVDHTCKSMTSIMENSSSKSLQRALVRAYGGHELPKYEFRDLQSPLQTDSSLRTRTRDVDLQLIAADTKLLPDRHRMTYTGETSIPSTWPSLELSEYPQKFQIWKGSGECYDSSFSKKKLDSLYSCFDGESTVAGCLISRKYPGEGKAHQELYIEEHANGGSFRGSPLTKKSFMPEHKYHPSISMMYPDISLGTRSPSAHDKSSSDSIVLNGPSTSYCLEGLYNSSFQDSPSVPHSSNSLQQSLAHSTIGSMPVGIQDVDIYGFNNEKVHCGSWSLSPLPHFGLKKHLQNEIAGTNLVPADGKAISPGSSWEPSMPFKSSFYHSAAGVTSPGGQYDPLSDSIEPSQSSPTHIKGTDDFPKGVNGLGDNDLKFNFSLCKSNEPIFTTSEGRKGVYSSSSAGVSELGEFNGVNSTSKTKEKSWSSVHAIDVKNMKENANEDGPRTQEKSRQQRETKALKNFRVCLVEFVKDLVKPAWREGHMSKDAHKLVVKKVAEKVLSALQPHQIPTSLDLINQYLSSSRSKIVKLVEGYVDKYAKS